MKPVAVRRSTLIWSPGRNGIPANGVSVQVWPSRLVQIETGADSDPLALAAGYEAGRVAGRRLSPSGVGTDPMAQEHPSLRDTKN